MKSPIRACGGASKRARSQRREFDPLTQPPSIIFIQMVIYLIGYWPMPTADLNHRAGAPLADLELVITRIFDAPRELVFKAWAEPDRAVRWWGPQGFTTAYCEMDVRPGGAYRVCMRSPEGTEHWQRGVCREVIEPERLVFTFAWEDSGVSPATKPWSRSPSRNSAQRRN